MKSLLAMGNGESAPFAPTHWSVIVAAGESQIAPETARAALAELCQSYWPPLYSFVRSRGYSVHDAQDLTQSFFADLLEHKLYARADRAKGKFRTFLLAALKNFLADDYARAMTLKRGGASELLPLDEGLAEEAESLFQTHADATCDDRIFEQTWAGRLVAAALRHVSENYRAEGKQTVFATLELFLTGGVNPLPAYDELAARTGVPASTLRSDVTRLRARYRAALRAEVRSTVESEAEVDGELRELLRILTGG